MESLCLSMLTGSANNKKAYEHAPFVTLIRINLKMYLIFICYYLFINMLLSKNISTIRRVHILLLGILMLNIKSLPLRLPLMLRQQEKSKKK